MKKCITTYELVNAVVEKVKGEQTNLFDITDYCIIDKSDIREIKDIEFDVIAVTNFGSSEGIYTDIILNGNIGYMTDIKIRVCVIKTLRTDKCAYMRMSRIGAEIAYECHKYVMEHQDELIRAGYKVVFKDKTGRKIPLYICKTQERAVERAKSVLERTDYYESSEIVDLYKQETVLSIGKKEDREAV